MLSTESLESLSSGLDIPIPLSAALLADARFFEWTHAPEGKTVAVRLAAIASEVHVKQVIRSTAGERAQLVEMLLSKPRDFSVAARVLFSQVMEAVNGRSLKAENPTLEKAQSASEVRNRIAHRGEIPDLASARAAVATAVEVAKWLEGVVRDHGVQTSVQTPVDGNLE